MSDLSHRQKRVMTIAEFCRDYSLSKTKAYEYMAAGKLRSLKLGSKRVITVDAAEDFLKTMAVQAGEVV